MSNTNIIIIKSHKPHPSRCGLQDYTEILRDVVAKLINQSKVAVGKYTTITYHVRSLMRIHKFNLLGNVSAIAVTNQDYTTWWAQAGMA